MNHLTQKYSVSGKVILKTFPNHSQYTFLTDPTHVLVLERGCGKVFSHLKRRAKNFSSRLEVALSGSREEKWNGPKEPVAQWLSGCASPLWLSFAPVEMVQRSSHPGWHLSEEGPWDHAVCTWLHAGREKTKASSVWTQLWGWTLTCLLQSWENGLAILYLLGLFRLRNNVEPVFGRVYAVVPECFQPQSL